MTTRWTGVTAVALVCTALLATGCDDASSDVATRLTVTATDPGGGPADDGSLETTRRNVESRLQAAGYDDVEVRNVGSGKLTVTVAGQQDATTLGGYLAPGDLAFRLVRDLAAASGATPAATGAVPTGPAAEQFATAACDQLNARASVNPAQPTVACDPAGSYRYLLDAAAVRGTDVKDAEATTDPQTGMWVVNIGFNAAGQTRWTNLTKTAYNNTDNRCSPSSVDESGHCAVAIVVDAKVLSAPTIQAVITGDAVVAGGVIDAPTARRLAAALKSGALPLSLRVTSSETVRR
ncbi:hypothetical protein GCM10009682_62500 [Luedemannella flava]|uniref:SecDF P1 head subdomain domain-containing protein n=1 Tax=Luedemannella flava TaxID=349316 RepID=A0ABN2MRN8_9ACTN